MVSAQTNNSGQLATYIQVQDWQGLRDIEPGKKILIEFKTGGKVDGKLVNLVGSTLSLSDDGDIYILEQSDIQRVYRLKGRWSREKVARIGAGIGMVVGTLVGAGKMVRAEEEVGHISSSKDTAPLFGGGFIGALAGAGLGALLGGKRKGELLYEAK
jgi:hypothetical protein